MVSPEELEHIKSLRLDLVERSVTRAIWTPHGYKETTSIEQIHPVEISNDPNGDFVFVSHLRNSREPYGRWYSSMGYIDNSHLGYFAKKLASGWLIPHADYLVPVPNGANRLSRMISESSGIPTIPLLFKKGTGKNRRLILNTDESENLRLEGETKSIVLIEDTVTKGKSSEEALDLIGPLIDKGKVSVLGVAAVLDREEGAAELFATLGLEFCSVLTKRELFEKLLSFKDSQILTQAQYDFVMNQD